jgi:uncharacterized protein (TIGR04255 family)
MSEWEVFRKSPITEAIIDVQVSPPKALNVQELELTDSPIRTVYPDRKSIRMIMFQGNVTIEMGQVPQLGMASRGDHIGFAFTSEDRQAVFQWRLNGFSHHKLKPYTDWKTFKASAASLWQEYCAVAHPEFVTRLGVRFVNLIEIPIPVLDFKDFLTTVPEIGDGVPQGLTGLFMRLELPDTDTGNVAIVTEAMTPLAPESNNVGIIFDIDTVFQSTMNASNGTEMWAKLDQLRDLKNRVFFQSLTERTKERFR